MFSHHEDNLLAPSPTEVLPLSPHGNREAKELLSDDHGYGSCSPAAAGVPLGGTLDVSDEEVFFLELGEDCSRPFPVHGGCCGTGTPEGSPPSKRAAMQHRRTPTNPKTGDGYSSDVHAWMLGLERRFTPDNFLSVQTDVSQEMRRTMLRWLVSVNRQFDYSLDTWCLTVNVMDRFLSLQLINRDCLQLVGLTSFFIAAKHEEVEPPEISELVSLCARSYEPRQFMWMEFIILSHIKFELMAPSVAFFLWHLIEKDVRRRGVWPLAFTRTLVERLLCEGRFSTVLPSVLARSLYDFLAQNFVMTCLVANVNGPAVDADLLSNFYELLYSALAIDSK